MDSEILSYADEILSMSFESALSKRGVLLYIKDQYGLDRDKVDAVIAVLEGEGYFDV